MRLLPSNLILERRIRLGEVYINKKLEEYFSASLLSGKFGFLPNGVTSINVLDVKRLGGSNDVYSFVLSYQNMGYEKRINLVLKIYVKTLEPVLNAYADSKNISRLSDTCPKLYCVNFETCVKEFEVLKGLERVGFPAPRVYLCEYDYNILGSPFIIMEKEKLTQNHILNIDCFAKNLAHLHGLDVAGLGITVIKTPEDMFAFARRYLFSFKILLNLLPKGNKSLMKDFELAIHWLESNVTKSPCTKYCLLHGDYRASNNAILLRGSRNIVMDWETAEIGDPTYDVGYAYSRMRVELGEKTANRFVKEYMSYFNEDLTERLLFYKLGAHLRLAILHSSILSNPLTAYEVHRIKAFLLFPFLRLPFISKMTGAYLDIAWVENFEDFVKENLR